MRYAGVNFLALLFVFSALVKIFHLLDNKRVAGWKHRSTVLHHDTRVEIFCLISYLHMPFLVPTCFDSTGSYARVIRPKRLSSFGAYFDAMRKNRFLAEEIVTSLGSALQQ